MMMCNYDNLEIWKYDGSMMMWKYDKESLELPFEKYPIIQKIIRICSSKLPWCEHENVKVW